MISAKILADSINPQGDRLTTMEIVFPRIVLAEFNTHRLFSRNSASSRAIPFNKMVKMVEENPFIPIAWQKDHKGMQGTEYWTDDDTITVDEGDAYERYTKIYSATEHFITEWLEARDLAIAQSYELNRLGVTKQLCNRLLEPFMWHTVLVTATEFENFFELRCPKYYYEPENKYFKSKRDYSNYWFECFGSGIEEAIEGDPVLWWLGINQSQAEIHIQALAEAMWDAMNESTPKQLQPGEYHLPFVDNFDTEKLNELYADYAKSLSDGIKPQYSGLYIDSIKIKIAVARCARISYETLGDNPKIDYEADIRLHDILTESGHWSPCEHVARCMTEEEYLSNVRGELGYEEIIRDSGFETAMFYSGSDVSSYATGWCRNFRGFIQYRSMIDNQ